jgi:hypothetical protein
MPCPQCGSENVIPGTLEGDRGWASPVRFVPAGVPWFRWERGVPLHGGGWFVSTHPAMSCASCGLTWTRVNAARLRAFVERYGNQADVQPAAKKPRDDELA